MNGILDNINDSLSTVTISRGRYDSLLIAERQRDDLFDLITNRFNEAKGIDFSDIKLIYDMQIKRVDYNEQTEMES